MGARDSGWIQLFAEDAQEEYDNLFQAMRIAEHPSVQLPAMTGMDGFIVSHAMQGVEVYSDEAVREFVGIRDPQYSVLDPAKPITVGALDLFDYYFEHKRAAAEAMRTAKTTILEVADEFAQRFGRKYGLIEGYCLDDAEIAIVVIGSAAGTTRTVVDALRANGVKAGMLKLRVFRPFPLEELAAALGDRKVVAVLDRAEGMSGHGGPLFPEIKAALYDLPTRPAVVNYVYGLGGRDFDVEQISHVFDELQAIARTGRITSPVQYLGVRE
jgi:pyruvate ferredoxin oxidoreductase alpha subunit